MFYHFDIATFSDGGEGDWPRQGHLDPSLYNPAKLNTDQWLEAAKAMGAGYTVFVAKHCRAMRILTVFGSRSGGMAKATWSPITWPRAGSAASGPASIAACQPTPTATSSTTAR
jgi:hypothetical protein